MQRDFRFDIARSICLFYIVAILHLSQYLGQSFYLYNTFIGRLITFSCLGLFTFISGYLIGKKYTFTPTSSSKDILRFYKKRFIRIYPMFFLATILLCLIGFNSLLSSALGLIGMASFVTEQPKTLWYVSMLILFYLLTPLVNRKSTLWKILMSTSIIVLFCTLKLFIPVDTRFIFNLFFYCLGLVLSNINVRYFNRTDHSNTILHIAVIVGFIAFLLLTNRFYQNTPALLFTSAIGVMALFSLSNLLSNIHNQAFSFFISFISYASMVCYMFHRFYYWAGLKVFSPGTTVTKVIYMITIFTIGLVVSFFIQKRYDHIIQKVNSPNLELPHRPIVKKRL